MRQFETTLTAFNEILGDTPGGVAPTNVSRPLRACPSSRPCARRSPRLGEGDRKLAVFHRRARPREMDPPPRASCLRPCMEGAGFLRDDDPRSRPRRYTRLVATPRHAVSEPRIRQALQPPSRPDGALRPEAIREPAHRERSRPPRRLSPTSPPIPSRTAPAGEPRIGAGAATPRRSN